ncbi:MAG: SPASM domain-containing protein [Candidatus Muiribacteriota bacterium]
MSEIKGHKKNYADYFDFIQSKLLNNELIKDGKLIRDFGVIVNRQQKNRGCGAGSATVTVMNDGSVYPCYKINNNKYLMGNIFDKELSERQNYSILEFENIKCRDCWARLICGGGCPGEGLFFKGDLEDKSEYVCQMEKCTIKGMLGIIIDTYVENYDKYLELFTNKKQEQQEQNPKEEEKNG